METQMEDVWKMDLAAMDQEAIQINDREIYRAAPDDSYYSDRLFITADGGLGFDIGGHCVVKPLREWFRLAAWSCRAQPRAAVPSDCNHPFCDCDPHAARIIEELLECGWQPPKPLKTAGTRPSPHNPLTTE